MTKKAPAIVVPKNPMKPLFMWAGGKTKILKKYKELGMTRGYSQFDSFVEPFFGGGAFFCDVAFEAAYNRFTIQQVINDINPEIMYIYFWIRESPEKFIVECEKLLNVRNKLPTTKAARKPWFEALRQDYWNAPDLRLYPKPVPATLKTAAMLYVLMKTGFNGVWQTSQANNGKYGTAVGAKHNISINPPLIRLWSRVLKKTSLYSGSYQDLPIPPGHALIYVDPPYRSSATTYGQSFTDADQTALVKWCIEKSRQNHTVIFANRDIADGFFRVLFRKHEDEYQTFEKSYLGSKKKSDELVVVLDPERLKRHQIIIDGKPVTISTNLLWNQLKKNPIIKELGLTANVLLQTKRRREKAEAEAAKK